MTTRITPLEQGRLLPLTLGALGVVYGDIGTSPLYAFRLCFHGSYSIAPEPGNVLGVLSLIFWTLILVVCVKYLTFVLRADNKGQGGILSLLSLAFGDQAATGRQRAGMVILGVIGAALLYGDGMVTPCITVLGAMEGLEVATPMFSPYIVPLTIVVLVLLFAFQKVGTAGVGRVFGPVMVLWFGTIAILGIRGILQSPEVFLAINPYYAVKFLWAQGLPAFVVLGAVFLVVTGAEALYADLGHFGAKPIRRAWFFLVFPALMLNYLGQGALLLKTPEAVENPFFNLSPEWFLYPLVLVATIASAVASQALISGAYSITMQAIQLGYLPRMEIRHTSSQERGQIYMPFVNWMLLVCCIGLVLGFGSSSRLSGAYGIAVTLDMLITSLLFYFAARRLWQWNRVVAGLLTTAFLFWEIIFFSANAVKIAHGGWFTLLVAAGVFTIMATWKRGRQLLSEQMSHSALPFDLFLESVRRRSPHRVPGTAVFMSSNSTGTPLALLHNFKHNQVLHQRIVLLTMVTTDVPKVRPSRRVRVEPLSEGFSRVVATFGYMETPRIQQVFEACRHEGLDLKPEETTFFLSRESIIASPRRGMATWRERLFAFLSRNAQTATAFFGLPANRVVELGMQVEI